VQSGIESGWNETRWIDPELEELVAEANTTTDAAPAGDLQPHQ
jgi:ABC-type transport system substrate-binding protein